MAKTRRTLTMDSELSRALSLICVRHGDATWHVEQALASYKPIKLVMAKSDTQISATTKAVISAKPKFVKPELSELGEYFYSNGHPSASDEAQKFIDYFDGCGWLVGKKKAAMKDWRACVRTWMRNNSHENSNRSGQQHKSSRNQSTAERVDAAMRAKSGGNGNAQAPMDYSDRHLYGEVQKPGSSNRDLGQTFEGTCTRTS